MKYQRLLALSLIVLASVGAARLAEVTGGLTGIRQLEPLTLDIRQRTTPESFQDDSEGLNRESEIVLILFDSLSVEQWPYLVPFPRAVLAELVEAVSGAGARTIGIDVFLDRLYESTPEQIDGDRRLRAAIAAAGNVILAAPTPLTEAGPMLAQPHRFFAEAAADIGAAELPTAFETSRNATLAVRSGERLEPSFALAMYANQRGIDVDSLLLQGRRTGRIALEGLSPLLGDVPDDWWVDGEAGYLVEYPVHYHGPPTRTIGSPVPKGTFQAYPSSTAATVATFVPEAFRDKIVLMGTGFHNEDKFRTSFFDAPLPEADSTDSAAGPYGWMYGVEIHANSLQNMLDAEYVVPLSEVGKSMLMLVLGLVVAAATFARGASWGGVAAVLCVLGVTAIALWAWQGGIYITGDEPWVTFGTRFLWVPIVVPALTIAFAYLGSVAYVSVVEGREKRFIKGAFGMYVSPEVVADIAERPELLQLGGQKRPLSLLFSDLRGFTTLSERLDPQELIARLNDYLTEMTAVVMDEGGTLDKYIGDAIMAFWNAPKDLPDHADHALRAMVMSQRKMAELNARWRADDPDHEDMVVRIGVNTGEVVVGNVGGENRFDYSAIGDAVNLAARLEPANKSYDTLTMCSEFTLDAADAAAFRVRELDLITVKGKEKPVRVYEVLELAGVELAPSKEDAISSYDQGMAAYKQHDWTSAREHFLAALEACPDDGPSRVYAARCADHVADPPATDWDFVVRRTVK